MNVSSCSRAGVLVRLKFEETSWCGVEGSVRRQMAFGSWWHTAQMQCDQKDTRSTTSDDWRELGSEV